ncbi:hypothetical protein [Edaphobacter aggregans]|uniref:hypothetical protein n=1 Tax=Edaphobacter aggregans TaxID=570835 RepID=UPI000556CFCB|nr:hypothetical protein [Edaphobacter aggregans]
MLAGDLTVAMVWQVAGAKNADAARRFARAPFQQIALIGGRTPLQFDLCSGIGTPVTVAVITGT